MATLMDSSARTRIDVAEASEIARMARTDDPNVLAREDLQGLLGSSALVLDGLRTRPSYFDGRFLTGADLTRDQEYIRQRQADLARSSGTGVVAGLQVSLGADARAQTLVIEAGHGITPAGDLVMISNRREIVALDIPSSERLDASFGLRRVPRAPLGRRNGLFVLALRSVEFTANPIAAYPTSVTGPRRIEDGDVIEATAITLVPYPDTGGAATLDEARRLVARRLFLEQATGLPQEALPIAMVAMERGAIRWIDAAMVRRETGADTPLQVSMGARPRALAEAHVLQYRAHLADVLDARGAGGLPPAFAAAQYFAALPAAGQLPAAAILTDPLGFTQLWFPPAMEVDIGFAPSDEIAALVEESLALPPIDLAGSPEDLDATGVVVIAPVTRQRLQRFEAALSQLQRATVPQPAQGVRRAPAQMLAAMLARRGRLARLPIANADVETVDAETRAWQAAWAEAVAALPAEEGEAPLLWYVRRRAIAERSTVNGVAVVIGGDDEAVVTAIDARIGELGLTDRLAAINARATPFAAARIVSFLGAARILGSDLFLSSAVRDLEEALPSAAVPEVPTPGPFPIPTPRPRFPTGPIIIRRPNLERMNISRIALAGALGRTTAAPTRLTEADVVDVAAGYGEPRLGDGIERIATSLGNVFDRDAQLFIGGTGLATELDAAGRETDAGDFADFALGVSAAVTARDTSQLARLLGIEA